VSRKKGWTLYYKNDISLSIDIPKAYAEAISINSSSADATLKNFSVNKFMFQSDLGDINLDDIAVNDLSIETSSGRVALSNFSGNANVKSDSGDVRIEYETKSSTENQSIGVIGNSNNKIVIFWSLEIYQLQNKQHSFRHWNYKT